MPKSQLYQGFAVCYTREKSKSALKGLKKESIGAIYTPPRDALSLLILRYSKFLRVLLLPKFGS